MQHFSNISFKPYNTFGVDEMAKDLFIFNHEKELIELLELYQNSSLFILGGGSNILVTQPLELVILKNEVMGIQQIEETDDHSWLKVGGGVVWHDLVKYAVNNGLGGLENMALIPGTVGAAPMQNIGAYGVELKDSFVRLEAIQLENGRTEIFDKKACAFDYRYSVFKGNLKNQFCITQVIFKLSKHPKLNMAYGAIMTELNKRNIENPDIKDIFNVVIDIRRSKLPDPAVIGNGGSFFKNPIVDLITLERIKSQFPKVPYYPAKKDTFKIPAGWLIEQNGWKGYKRNDIGVYPHHALVLVNWGNGKGADIWRLAQDIQKSVLEKFGVKMVSEVNII